jgi:hypothetical protein
MNCTYGVPGTGLTGKRAFNCPQAGFAARLVKRRSAHAETDRRGSVCVNGGMTWPARVSPISVRRESGAPD